MTMTKIRDSAGSSALMYTLVLLFFLTIFLSFFRINLWDYDFWWHIATGKYILQHTEVPSQDPFSFVTEANRGKYPLSEARETFLMRQYWLAQVVMYLVYENFGPVGIRALRALLLTSCLLLVFFGFRHFRIPPLYAMIMIVPVFYVLLRKYTGERPVLFTFFFSILVTVILEKYLTGKHKSLLLFFLPPIMLVWSNMHGGFILGILIIGIYNIVEVGLFLRNKTRIGKDALIKLIALSAGSILVTILNPNGWLVFTRFQSKNDIFKSGINEYMPLLTVYLKKLAPFNGAVFLVLAFVVFVLLLRIVKMPLRRSLLVAGILFMSLKHQRFFAFTSLIGVFLVGLELEAMYKSDIFKRLYSPTISRIISLILIGTVLIFLTYESVALARIIKQDEKSKEAYKYKQVVDFIEQNSLKGRMFNADAFGGYLIWRLYPKERVFTDTRLIDIASLIEYNTISSAKMDGDTPIWQKLLDLYDVNMLVLKPLEYDGSLTRLVEAALESNQWILVYADGVALVFLKNNDKNRDLINRFALSNEKGYWSIIGSASFKAMKNTKNYRLFLTIGSSFVHIGNLEEARKAFMHVLKIDPDNIKAKNYMEEINASFQSH